MTAKNKNTCCGQADSAAPSNVEYETIKLEKAKTTCPACENYAKSQTSKPIAVICCEGACLRGEVARQAANLVCHSLAPEKTVRICLGGAFTKDTGQRKLVKNARQVVAIEGCFIKCGSRTMKSVVEKLDPKIIIADGLYDFDRSLYGVDEMSASQIRKHAKKVAAQIVKQL